MSPAEFIIRPMTLADVGQVYALDTISFSLPWPERSYRYEIQENRNSRPWVVEDVGVVPARIAAMLVIWLVLNEAHVATIAVHPDYRRRGLGQRLLAHGLLSAENEGAELAYLEVRQSNLGAQALYQRFGFVVDGVRPHYYVDNGEDAILMSLRPLDPQALTALLNASETIS